MSPETHRLAEQKPYPDKIDTIIGVGTSLGLFIAGIELIKIIDEHSINAVQLFASRVATVLVASLGGGGAAYLSSRIRNKQ